MTAARVFKTFILGETCLRVASDRFEEAVEAVREQRTILEGYIEDHPDFKTSMKPLAQDRGAPAIVQRMTEASKAAGVGPMAAVAGVFAQVAGEAASAAGSRDTIIDNGGDLYLDIDHDAVVGIYSGGSFGFDLLAFLVSPEDTPLSICSSSSKLGHSVSFGNCDLATVTAKNAALADAAATRLANLVKTAEDLEGALETVSSVPGILGALAIIGKHLGTAGKPPRIIRTDPSSTASRITVHPDHRF